MIMRTLHIDGVFLTVHTYVHVPGLGVGKSPTIPVSSIPITEKYDTRKNLWQMFREPGKLKCAGPGKEHHASKAHGAKGQLYIETSLTKRYLNTTQGNTLSLGTAARSLKPNSNKWWALLQLERSLRFESPKVIVMCSMNDECWIC